MIVVAKQCIDFGDRLNNQATEYSDPANQTNTTTRAVLEVVCLFHPVNFRPVNFRPVHFCPTYCIVRQLSCDVLFSRNLTKF